MNKQIIKISIIFLAGYIFIFPQATHAVIPPDFIFNIGAQVAQFFSIIIIFLTAVLGTFFQIFKAKYYSIKHKKTVLIIVIFSVIVVSLGSSYLYAGYRQQGEYQKWLAESEKNKITQDNVDPNNDEAYFDENDKLNIGSENNQDIDTSQLRFVSGINTTDDSGKFISDYYKNIANGNLEQAYEMSKKSVGYDTFRGWYIETSKITLDNLIRIDEKKSSIELTLFESDRFIRYGVLMTLGLENGFPVKVEKSEVKILAQGTFEDNNAFLDDKIIKDEYNFYDENQDRNILISNQEFKNVTESGKNGYFILDARENIEFENGNFPGSKHVRFADLKAGRWIEIPKDKFVYVLCWSGIRGKEVAEFLRTKKIVSSYLENGANGWVKFGGTWDGNIKFGEKYNEPRYQKVFTTDEAKRKSRDGVIFVDSREPYKFSKSQIAGSVNIPIMHTPTINLENVFNQVPEDKSVITVCDEYVNCFDAKITGVELERRGHEFLGRYNKPWEYEK